MLRRRADVYRYYEDIIERINEPPRWFDERAVPRYCDFSPDQIANIYARECALILVACQNCGRRFRKAVSHDPWEALSVVTLVTGAPPADSAIDRWRASFRRALERRQITYHGNPPNMRCCPAGPTMTADFIAVLEYWRRDDTLEWTREREVEWGSVNV
jgi:hypothetical protein